MQYREPGSLQMRIDKHEDSRIQGRVGATASLGSQPCSGGLPTANRCRVLGRSSEFRVSLDEGLSSGRGRRLGGTRSLRPPAKAQAAHKNARSWAGFGVRPRVSGFPPNCGPPRGWRKSSTASGGSSFIPAISISGLPSGASRRRKPRFQAREQDETEVQRWAARGLAANKKSAARRRAPYRSDRRKWLLALAVGSTHACAARTNSGV